MNREIKFRAWDRVDKVMLYGINEIIPSSFIEYQQYTGLKDKNGKEIYEGDIVEFPATLDGNKKGRSKVFFSDGCFITNGLSRIDNEVIGNIYENPELLEKK